MFKYLLLVGFVCLVNGDACGKATVTHESYTTTERRLSDDTAFVVKFNLRCSNGAQGIPLYAEVGGKQYPVTKSPEGNTYQLSWVVASSKSSKGTHMVRFFDEDGISVLRKAIRNGEDTSQTKSLFNVEVVHPGNAMESYITSETIGLLVAGLIYYAVSQLKSEVVN